MKRIQKIENVNTYQYLVIYYNIIITQNNNKIMSANIFSFDNDGFPILNESELSKFTCTDKKSKHVICLVGQARMGKSFFLNCFNALLTNNMSEIFSSKVGDNHCTKGINVYESEQYIFIDCQGLKYEDSKGDDKLLLIAYTLSDVVIVNGIKTLDNTMFSFIEPISVFENHLKKSKPKTHKPTLVFKIMDYQMDDEPDEKIISQLNKLMKKTTDNYQTLRNTLELLFNETPHAIYTLPPDRSEKKYLKNNDYKYALESDDLHFFESIQSILSVCEKLHDDSKVTQEQFIDK
jgi:GTP-binding protein EngB required for normal cell division